MLQPFASPKRRPDKIAVYGSGMSRRPENPLPVRERIPPAINKTTRCD